MSSPVGLAQDTADGGFLLPTPSTPVTWALRINASRSGWNCGPQLDYGDGAADLTTATCPRNTATVGAVAAGTPCPALANPPHALAGHLRPRRLGACCWGAMRALLLCRSIPHLTVSVSIHT
jgi:hypothetical protein